MFNIRLRIPGQYNGSETCLPEGILPEARLRISSAFRKYLEEKVKVEFDGIDASNGIIAEAVDEATGAVDEVMTVGNILTIHGTGIKIEGDDAHRDLVGVFFVPNPGVPIKASVIAVNSPKTLKVLVPPGLTVGTAYQVAVETQSSVKGAGALVKKVRDIRSDFTLIAA